MNRNRLGIVCQVVAVLTIACSMIPRAKLFYFENGHWLKRSQTDVVNWDYLILRSWCVIAVGVLAGAILFWLGSRLKTNSAGISASPASRFSAKRLVIIFGMIFIGTLLVISLPNVAGLLCQLDRSDRQIVPPPAHHLTAVEAQTNLAKAIARINVRVRPSEFNEEQMAEFRTNFDRKYRPAVSNWCNAYKGHLPFSLAALTADKFVERLGRGESFYTYTFMVDGVTVCVTDENGSARMFYLNAPQTQQLMGLPKGSSPFQESPIPKNEIKKMLKLDSGADFADGDINIIPSGFSSALNGGAYVSIGGDPNNSATWKYTLVFGSDGKLAYYLKGR